MRSAPISTHIDQGVQFLNEGKSEEAEREWKQVVQLDADNLQAWELLGDMYLQKRNFREARTAFDNVYRLAPDTPDLDVRMAIVAYQFGDNDKARILAQQELKENPKSVAALQVLINVEKGVNPDAYLSALQRLAEVQPQNVQALNAVIDELHTRDAYDRIIPLADKLVKLAPNSSDSYLRRGVALYIANPESDSMDRARSDFQKALQIDPKNVEAHRYLGRLYMRQNHPRLAIAEFEAVGKGRPYASAHLMELSQAYRRAGETQLADKTRARFTLLRENNERWINLSDQIKREPQKGEYYLQMALLLISTAFGDNTDLYHLYSFQVGQGQLFSVEDYLNKAIELTPKDPGISSATKRIETVYSRYMQLGEEAARAGKYAQAKENVARALLIRPHEQRTLRLEQQVKAAGFDPAPHYSPEAVPNEHQR